MIKLAIAVGVANKINIAARVSPLKPIFIASIVAASGIIKIFIVAAIIANLESLFILSKFNEPPIPIKAKGKVMAAKYSIDLDKNGGRTIWYNEKGIAKTAANRRGFVKISQIVF